MVLATLCYIRKNGKTLMLHRVKKENDMHEGKWNTLGGKCESGETPEECVYREVKEESGLTPKNLQLKGHITFPKATGKGETWHVYIFTANGYTGKMIDSKEGKMEWIEDDKLYDLPMWEGDETFMRWLDKPGFFSAKFTYGKKGLEDHSVIFYE
ncbi:NUDIX domain-containing protein [Patescibacteria group bacterium]